MSGIAAVEVGVVDGEYEDEDDVTRYGRLLGVRGGEVRREAFTDSKPDRWLRG